MTAPRVGIIGFRYDASSSFERGAADGPPAIHDALWSSASNMWTESGIDLGDGVLEDAGDRAFDDAALARDGISSAIREILSRALIPIALGGDHSITYPIVRAVGERHPGL